MKLVYANVDHLLTQVLYKAVLNTFALSKFQLRLKKIKGLV